MVLIMIENFNNDRKVSNKKNSIKVKNNIHNYLNKTPIIITNR